MAKLGAQDQMKTIDNVMVTHVTLYAMTTKMCIFVHAKIIFHRQANTNFVSHFVLRDFEHVRAHAVMGDNMGNFTNSHQRRCATPVPHTTIILFL